MKMRKELNNKGFSLVELLIATIILGIVVAPLLHSFVTAASTTARSRQMGDATLLGENVAELVETTAMTKTALEALFEDPSFDTNTTNETNDPPASTYSVEIKNREDGSNKSYSVYSLKATGVPSGSSTFNVEVTLDPSAYQTGTGINDVKLSDYSNMDGIYAQSLDVMNPDVLAYAEFQREAYKKHKGDIGNESVNEEQLWDPDSVEAVRTITIDIADDDGAIFAILSMAYTFYYTFFTTDETGAEIEEAGFIHLRPREYDLVRDFSPDTEGRLPNIYVMYYPLYESNSRINDIIIINNMVNKVTRNTEGTEGTEGSEEGASVTLVPNTTGKAEPFKIFLVKEKAEDANQANKEFGYNARVEQYVPAGTLAENYAVVYSNIRENLVSEGTLGNNVTYDIYRGRFFSDIGRFGGDDPNKGGDLVSKTERDRMYDVTVKIYDAKDTSFTTPIHTAYATKLQ